MNDYELLYYIYQKDEEALSMLIEKYKKNVQFVTRKVMEQNNYVCSTSDEFNEMVHLGLIELNQAIYNYCDDGRCSFQVFSQKCIEMCIRKYIRHRRSLANYQFANALSLDNQIKDTEGVYHIESIRSNYSEFEGDLILKWYHQDSIYDFLRKHLKVSEFIIAEMKIEGYTHMEISQILMIQPKRVYYVYDKIKKLLMSYID